jgi:hypothetical protein
MVDIRVRPIRPRDAIKDVDAFVANLTTDVRTVIADGQRWVAVYPPQTLTKTGYVRTGTLKRSWSHRLSRPTGAIVGVVGSNANIAPYNRPVQGDPQVKIFQTAGWRGVDGLRQRMQNDIDRRVRATVRKFAR